MKRRCLRRNATTAGPRPCSVWVSVDGTRGGALRRPRRRSARRLAGLRAGHCQRHARLPEAADRGTRSTEHQLHERHHVHDGHESASYLISGEDVELWTGPHLQHREVAQAGDFLYIPAGVLHVAVNRSQTMPAVFVGARTDANEQESVILRPDLDERVP
jgi:mannose-6-phosphate isomerase-like protein (cupin superfamily)